jgi:hypothetical protein
MRIQNIYLQLIPLLLLAFPVHAVEMEVVPYGGWENCIRLSNGEVELVATTDVGPRIIRYAFTGEPNVFKEYPNQMGQTGGEEWRIYGGHRLWHAPEAKPRTYSPDNGQVKHEWDGETLVLTQPVEGSTGIQKEIEITLAAEGSRVTVLHRLINRNLWEIEAAPWCLTMMNAGGRAILPQEPYQPHSDRLTPVRPLVLWGYTDMADPRWTWGTKYIQLRQDSQFATAQKVGLLNTLGWAAYSLDNRLFVKRYGYDPKADYPDFMCNTEVYTGGDMLELETLGPQAKIEPGGNTEATEEWYLFKESLPTGEEGIEKVLDRVLGKSAVSSQHSARRPD